MFLTGRAGTKRLRYYIGGGDTVRENGANVAEALDAGQYSTGLVFYSKQTLASLYEELARHPVLTVKAETVATVLGRSIAPNLAQQIGILSGWLPCCVPLPMPPQTFVSDE
jgi:hypothetical protein